MSLRSFPLSLAFALSIGAPTGSALAQPVLQFVERELDGTGGADLLAGAFGVAASSDGRFVYVCGALDDSLTVFARDATTGALGFASATTPGLDALDSATDVALSPDGEHLYATGTLSDTVAVFARDAATGALSFVERVKENENGITDLNGARASVVSPDGKHVYVASLIDSTVASFARDAATGALTHIGTARDGQDGVDGLAAPVSITTSADGTSVYVAGNVDDAIVVFAREPSSGALTFVEAEHTALDGPSGAAVSPDGRHVYVPNGTADSVVRFDRDATTGALEFVETIANGGGAPPVDGLDGASEIAMTPDGRFVFVTGAGATASTIVSFSRDAATGALQFLEVDRDGEGGFDGMANPLGLALAAGGRSVYVTGFNANAVAVLAPEPAAFTIAATALASLAVLARTRTRR